MKSNKYELLVSQLNNILSEGGNVPPVSPTSLSSSGEKLFLSRHPFISIDMKVENLDYKDVLLVHTLLHKFYSTKNKNLSKQDIKFLHDKISTRMNHKKFDKLDD